jgi:glyoxylase-like metal-dependent hydrolase (beta-lactamase superfamily II)
VRRLSKNVYTEIYFRGCNPGFIQTNDGYVMIDSPQQPINAMQWRERMEENAPIRYLVNTEWHGDHIRGNAYFPHVTVIGQEKLAEGFEARVFGPMMGRNVEEMKEKTQKSDPDSAYLVGHPDFPPVNGPDITFKEEYTFHVGNHSFHCLHMPGHTHPQTCIHCPDEHVVFTGDNIFCGCKTFLEEADPWDWLASLDRIEALDVEWIVPGHGEPCHKDYLKVQRQIIENWLGAVGRMVDRGMTEDEAVAAELDIVAEIDPYPIGQRLFPFDQRLNEMNIRQIYRKIMARKAS